jgi:hypothetical protein
MRSASLPMSRWLRFWSGSAKQHSASLCISVFSMRMMAAWPNHTAWCLN